MLVVSVLSGCASSGTPKTIRQLLKVGENEKYVYCRPEVDYEPFKKIGIEDFGGPSSLGISGYGYEWYEKKLKRAGTATFKRAARQTAKMMNKCVSKYLKPNKKYYIDKIRISYENGRYELYYNGVKTGENNSRKYLDLFSWVFVSAEKHEAMQRETDKFLKAAGISVAAGTKKTNNASAKKKNISIPKKAPIKKKTIAIPKKATEADVLNFFDL